MADKDGKRAGAGSGSGSSSSSGSEAPDLAALGAEFARQFGELGRQLKSTFDQVADDAQYAFDKEMGKMMAKHPELYAELRKTMRQAQKTMDKAAEALGLDKVGKP